MRDLKTADVGVGRMADVNDGGLGNYRHCKGDRKLFVSNRREKRERERGREGGGGSAPGIIRCDRNVG